MLFQYIYLLHSIQRVDVAISYSPCSNLRAVNIKNGAELEVIYYVLLEHW